MKKRNLAIGIVFFLAGVVYGIDLILQPLPMDVVIIMALVGAALFTQGLWELRVIEHLLDRLY